MIYVSKFPLSRQRHIPQIYPSKATFSPPFCGKFYERPAIHWKYCYLFHTFAGSIPLSGKNMLPAALPAIRGRGSCQRLSLQKRLIVPPWCTPDACAPRSAAHPIICARSGPWDAAPVCTGSTPGAIPAPSLLELVFISENAAWARDFFAGQGKFSQEYWMYCKKI